MDWSEILTQREGEYMIGVIERLRLHSWALPLVNAIQQRGGVTFDNKPSCLKRVSRRRSLWPK